MKCEGAIQPGRHRDCPPSKINRVLNLMVVNWPVVEINETRFEYWWKTKAGKRWGWDRQRGIDNCSGNFLYSSNSYTRQADGISFFQLDSHKRALCGVIIFTTATFGPVLLKLCERFVWLIVQAGFAIIKKIQETHYKREQKKRRS